MAIPQIPSDPTTYAPASWPTEDPNEHLMFDATHSYNNSMGSAAMAPGFVPPLHYDTGSFPVSHQPAVSAAQSWGLHSTQTSFDSSMALWPSTAPYGSVSLLSTASMLDSSFDMSNYMMVPSPMMASSPRSDLDDSCHYADQTFSFDAFSNYTLSAAPSAAASPVAQSQSQAHSPVDTTSSSSGGGFQCNLCGDTFVNQKNLDRHFLSDRHNEHAPKFTCACGYVQARKDNYRRHLQSCGFRVDHQYTCSCGDMTNNKACHEVHIDKCGRKRRGKQPSR